MSLNLKKMVDIGHQYMHVLNIVLSTSLVAMRGFNDGYNRTQIGVDDFPALAVGFASNMVGVKLWKKEKNIEDYLIAGVVIGVPYTLGRMMGSMLEGLL